MPAETNRAFRRGLALLEALNRRGGGTPLALSRDTGIPRPTVYRMLETLEREGYVARSPSDEHVVLRARLRLLSDGFEDEEWITGIAAPVMFRLTAEIGWPCDLATLEGTEMLIRESTHRAARFSIDRAMAGRALPLLDSSLGQAFLAFAAPRERNTLLGLLGRSGDAALRRALAATRRRGYALRPGGGPWPHTGSLALPVHRDGRVVACMNAIWMSRAVSPEEGVRLCLTPLREAVREIEAGWPPLAAA